MTRIEELTLKYLDGELEPDEQAELETLLEDPHARATHLALMEQEAALRGLSAPADLAASKPSRGSRESWPRASRRAC